MAKREKKKTAAPKGDPSVAERRKETRKKQSQGIRRRWMLSSMAVVMVILLVASGVLIVSMYNSYYQLIEERMETQAGTAANFLKNYGSEGEYLTAARYYMNNDFTNSKIELQFLEPSGRILMSSLLDVSRPAPGTLDVMKAVSDQKVSSWTGRDPATGERIMAVSAPVVYNGAVVGVTRMVTSLKAVDQQMAYIIALVAAVCVSIIAVVWLTNYYFVRSILDPVFRVTETAKRIAAGSYGIQMEKRSDDEMGQLTDAINDMSLKIDQAEKTQSEFISSVSHELRTPLTAINGWAETLYNGEVRDAEDVKKGMGIIVSEARRLTNMVEELLEFSRIEAGRFNLSVEPLDITAELEDAVYTYREFFRRKGLALCYDEPEEPLPMVSGDPERLRQVFCNILDNADKHGGSGGRVDVSICQEEDDAVIRVRDYGPGIPEEELPHVKYKFYKGSSKARGSGIGLAVCEEIVTRHGGTLELANAEGGGCVATIRLPIDED
jgi:signal transduction histidine kinase